ncbi:hypothetical protein CDAR_19261 [Caerostris darwini]|uniref:Transmembrane protein n=1 Tax=Caerostris darwini TaxID=1538125 RepID=A0AAV4WBP0_9ARAC|nr:hypothetical protein CDAR_19261 [Caerostris darwini]
MSEPERSHHVTFNPEVDIRVFEEEPSPRRRRRYVCQTGEVLWLTVLCIVCTILLIFFVIIEVKGGPAVIRDKQLWMYVLAIWPALAIMNAVLHHRQQLRAIFRRNRMELPVRYEARDE